MSDSVGKDSIAAVPVCGASGSVDEASGVAGSLGLECATVADEVDPVQVPGLPDAGLPSAGGGHVNVENPGVGPSGVLLEMPNDVLGFLLCPVWWKLAVVMREGWSAMMRVLIL